VTAPTRFDAIVVGGGPAGSTCARHLVRAGLRTAIVDRARFPRVKLCAGWVSPAVWDELEMTPETYPGRAWAWRRCHVYLHGVRHDFSVSGHFIRRVELDQILLRRSGATLLEGRPVRSIERSRGRFVLDPGLEARWLVGAGGTHCPVARTIFAPDGRHPVAVQEREMLAGASELAACRIGEDGEPVLVLHDDLSGYAWNVPKHDWLNVGCGTFHARDVLARWREARDFFTAAGHVPPGARPRLERLDGTTYYLFDPAHLERCERDGALLAGDALGLAHPLTAEGILPAVVSGRLCAEAIVASDPGRYRDVLAAHPLFRDYRALRALRLAATRLRSASPAPAGVPRAACGAVRDGGPSGRFVDRATAWGFAWLMSGARLPLATRALGLAAAMLHG
jgi:flavin-dependent dehydrogenase